MSNHSNYINVFHQYRHEDEAFNAQQLPSHAQMSVKFDSEAERDAFLARFPKWVGVKGSRLQAWSEGAPTFTPIAQLHVDFRSKKGNEVNEQGIKRFARVLAERNDSEVPFVKAHAVNSFDTLEDALAAINSVAAFAH